MRTATVLWGWDSYSSYYVVEAAHRKATAPRGVAGNRALDFRALQASTGTECAAAFGESSSGLARGQASDRALVVATCFETTRIAASAPLPEYCRSAG